MRTQQTRLALFAGLLVLIAALAGCGGGSDGGGEVLDINVIATQTAAAAGGTTDEGEGQPLGEGGGAPTPTVEGDLGGGGEAAGGQTAQFGGVDISGLNLDTFRVNMQMTMSFEDEDTTMSFTAKFDRARSAVYTETDTMGFKSVMAYIDGTTYTSDESGICTVVEGDPMGLLGTGGINMAMTESNWPDFSLVEQGITVNGVQADHYRIQTSTSEVGLEALDAELWLAVDGNYPVRFRAAGTATDEALSAGIQGNFTLEYNLTDINQPLDIQAPPECEGAG